MKKTLSQILEGLLSKPHARLKFSEIRSELTRLSGQTVSQKEAENAIAVLREKRRDLVYAKFDRTFYLSNTPTWYSNSTDLSRKMPKDGYFGIVSDTHLGSHAERLDILNQAYNAFQKRGIKTVFHIGDVTDGFNQYRGHAQHVKVYGNAAQAIHTIKNYPYRKGITTYAIGGN